MISTVYSAITSAIEINSPAGQSVTPTGNKPSPARLPAPWEVIDNKLICRWVLTD